MARSVQITCSDCGSSFAFEHVAGFPPKRCDECRRARVSAQRRDRWFARREHNLMLKRESNERHAEKNRAKAAERYARKRLDPEWLATQAERVARWRKQNPETAQRWFTDNLEKIRQGQRRRYAENPEPARAREARRRAREAGAEGSFTAAEFLSLCEANGNRCAYCGCEAKLTADHVVPLAHGGSNFIENIVPACGPCNSSKRDRTVEEFLAVTS